MTSGMTGVPGPLVQVATRIKLLAAQSTVVEGQLGPRWSGYCSPVAATEPVGFMRFGDPAGEDNRNPLGPAALRRC
jgi:hypothetical protein